MANNKIFDELYLKKEAIGRMVFKTVSFFFIFFGLFLNWYTVSQVLYGIDILPISQKIFISFIDVVLIFIGYLFWRFRNNFERQVNIVILFFTIFICILATEAILNFMSNRSVSHPVVSILTKDCLAKEPYCVKANIDIKTKIGFDDTEIKTNSLGMTGEETSIENLKNIKRVALLGDSNTFGFWASSFKNSFAGMVAKALRENNMEVLNFGVPGYGVAQEEILLEEYAIKFKPSYVVLFFTNANDMKETYLGKDMHTITNDGMAVIDQKIYKEKMGIEDFGKDAVQEKKSIIKDFMTFIRNSYIYTYTYSFFEKSLKLSQRPIDLNNFLSPIYWSKSSYVKIGNKAKDETIEKINNVYKFCNERNIKFLIVAIPFYEQVYFKNSIGKNYNINFPQKYIEDYANSQNIRYLDLLPKLREYIVNNPQEQLYNEDNLHFNNNGHKITGDLVSEFLKNNILPN